MVSEPMRIGWLQRLQTAIEEHDQSMRALSIAAGLGENYVFQMIKGGKEPGAGHLARILDVLGQDVALYVLTGVKITPDDLEFITLMQGLSAESRADALRFFRGLQAGADVREPEPDAQG